MSYLYEGRSILECIALGYFLEMPNLYVCKEPNLS